jgi:hypothetical protein
MPSKRPRTTGLPAHWLDYLLEGHTNTARADEPEYDGWIEFDIHEPAHLAALYTTHRAQIEAEAQRRGLPTIWAAQFTGRTHDRV